MIVVTQYELVDGFNHEFRATAAYTLGLIQLTATLFTGATYLPHVVTRSILYWIWLLYAVVHRVHKQDKINPVSDSALITFAIVIMEVATYNNYKAKAELFIRIKQSEQAQR